MPDIPQKYDDQFNKELQRLLAKIKLIYNDAIVEVSIAAGTITHQGKIFNLDLSPFMKKKLQSVIEKMHLTMMVTIENSLDHAWTLANIKNDYINKNLLKRLKLSPKMQQVIYDPNIEALIQLKSRIEGGLNLSDRVWRLVKPFKFELEAGLVDGISKGISAAEMAKTMRKFLNNPDGLFRMVRNEKGKLQLSRAAKRYNPGRGVYRSSYKNALRLTGTETNMAYRTADYERWVKSPIVKGIEIRLSHNHPRYDICDSMVGEYPKDFLFRGWHPHCICFAIPIMITTTELSAMEDQLLGLAPSGPEIKQIKKIPAKAIAWMKDNADRVKGWKNKPYWVKDNPDYTSIIFKKAA